MKERVEEQFNRLYNETYHSTLKYVISKCDNINNVEDIMQNIYVRLFHSMKRNHRKIENEKAFLIKLAKNELFKYYSFKNKMKTILNISTEEEESLSIENIKDEKINIDEEILNKVSLESIFHIIDQQDLKTKKVMMLYYMEDLKIKEIAELLNWSESTVKTKIYRTIQKIKDTLSEVKTNE